MLYKKTRKQIGFQSSRSWGQYLPNIFKSKVIKEILEADFEGKRLTGPNILFISCQEPAGIGTDFIVILIMPQKRVISYPNNYKK